MQICARTIVKIKLLELPNTMKQVLWNKSTTEQLSPITLQGV